MQVAKQQSSNSIADAQRKLAKARIYLMRQSEFAMWGGVLMVGTVSVNDEVPTACTNGRDEQYGAEFILGLSDAELRFVVMHECLHKAFRHLTTWKKLYKKNPRLANMACDYVINLILVNLDPHGKHLKVPMRTTFHPDGTVKGVEPMALLDKRFAGMNSKQVFDILEQEQKKQGSWRTNNPGEGEGNAPGDGDESDGPQGFDDHDWDGAQDMSDVEQEKLKQEVEQALRQGKMRHDKIHGNGASSGITELDELLYPQVDWRQVLAEFITTNCSGADVTSWRRYNRRLIGQDVLMPSMISESMQEVVVGVDTSGSMRPEDLNRCMSEVTHALRAVSVEKLHILNWDTEVEQHEVVTADNVRTTEALKQVYGGGGTDPQCVVQYMSDKKLEPQCVIMFTDGYVPSWGTGWKCPVLWCIVDNKDAVPTVGTVTHITTN